uniref:G_PROTEIN_RECEP_F1_2 domain-containing protein n=2 Tax=Caenorhabditis tropicalis TaxID=1561998 RepID=A0A1I7UBG7_9PELO
MKNMKTALLIAHAGSTNLDLMLTVYSAPMLFFPSASGNPLGLLGSLGVPVKWQAYWGQVSICTYNNNAMLLMAFHGICSTLCTLLIYQPYRDLIKKIIVGKKEDDERRKSMATSSYLGKKRQSSSRAVAAAESSI